MKLYFITFFMVLLGWWLLEQNWPLALVIVLGIISFPIIILVLAIASNMTTHSGFGGPRHDKF